MSLFKKLVLLFSSALLVGCGYKGSISDTPQYSNDYGVFLGAMRMDYEKFARYKNVAIEIEEIDERGIEYAKQFDTEIYAYLSVGSLEEYKDYYYDFKDYKLTPYENWSDEYWMDVSYVPWQNKMIELALKFKELGADGLFLDNFDVYYEISQGTWEPSFKEDIYQGCRTILSKLSELDMLITVNSGSTFLERLHEENDPLLNKIDWYAQETVFTSIIDYNSDVFGRQNEEDKNYYLEVINMMKNYANILLIEYTEDTSLIDEIRTYCANNGLYFYIANSVQLK